MADFVIRDPARAETVLRQAQRAARVEKNAIKVATETGIPLAIVFPDGHIDATWEGSRYVSIVSARQQ